MRPLNNAQTNPELSRVTHEAERVYVPRILDAKCYSSLFPWLSVKLSFQGFPLPREVPPRTTRRRGKFGATRFNDLSSPMAARGQDALLECGFQLHDPLSLNPLR